MYQPRNDRTIYRQVLHVFDQGYNPEDIFDFLRRIANALTNINQQINI